MKNTRDPFDDELRNRLDNYSEEPDDKLWSGIASNIETVKPPFPWKKWLSIGSATAVITAAVLYFSLNNTMNKELAEAASASLVTETNKQQTEEDVLSSEVNNSLNGDVSVSEQATAGNGAQNGQRDLSNQSINDQEAVSTSEHQAILKQSRKRSSERSESQSTAQRHDVASLNSNSSAVTSTTVTSINNAQQTEIETTRRSSNSPNDSHAGLVEGAPTQSSSPQSAIQINAIADRPQIAIETQSTSAVDPSSDKKQSEEKDVSDSIVVSKEAKDSLTNKIDRKSVFNVVAKDDGEKKDKQRSTRKLSLYLTAMPTFGYQRIEANQNDNVFVESISKVSNFSTKRLGVRAEIGAEYALNKKFRVFGGVLYYQRKQTIEYVERVPVNDIVENPVDTVVIIQPEFTSQVRTFEYELRNLGLQVGVNYVLKEKKFLHTIGTGIEFHKALNKLPAEQQDLGFSSVPSTFVFANIYYRLQYPAQGRLRAVFQPTFNYSLYLNQDMNAPFFVKPYGLGLNVGLTYHF